MRSLVKIAVAGALLASGATAYADVATPELPATASWCCSFVTRRTSPASDARGLGITMNQLLTSAQIVADPTKPSVEQQRRADTDTLTYSLPAAIGPDANLTAFLSRCFELRVDDHGR